MSSERNEARAAVLLKSAEGSLPLVSRVALDLREDLGRRGISNGEAVVACATTLTLLLEEGCGHDPEGISEIAAALCRRMSGSLARARAARARERAAGSN